MTDTGTEQAALRLFEEAPEGDVEAWLEALDAPAAVKARLRALLAADRQTFAELQTGGAAQSIEIEAAPDRIGNYRIAGLIGRGGMGAVYRGERAVGDFDHAVAIKVVRPGPLASALAERFRRERAILAGLDHPNICRLFDGGETDDGSPYFVMEHVDGVTLQALLEEKSRSQAEALALFRQVCRAVAHAHQKLIAHGDITRRRGQADRLRHLARRRRGAGRDHPERPSPRLHPRLRRARAAGGRAGLGLRRRLRPWPGPGRHRQGLRLLGRSRAGRHHRQGQP
jgi:eukaryotic-like serine/threonine-protein kinase